MTVSEAQEYTAKERIKAYIYFGVDAEMELIEASNALTHGPEDDREYNKRRVEQMQNKIKRANERISDLQVFLGVEHVEEDEKT